MKKSAIPFLAISATSILLLSACEKGAQTPAKVQSAQNLQTQGIVIQKSASLRKLDLNPWPKLERGNLSLTTANVKTAQHLLNYHGHQLLVDGDFGVLTAKAVRIFQTDNYLDNSGIVDADTWEELITNLEYGNKNNAVKALQIQLGIYTDGYFGKQTRDAVKKFQKKIGLTANGKVNAQTWQALVAGVKQDDDSDDDTNDDNLRITLAKKILKNPKIILSRISRTENGAPYRVIKDTAQGKKVAAACFDISNCGKKVHLDVKILKGLLKIANNVDQVHVSNITGNGRYDSTSLHNDGHALDFDFYNGNYISSSHYEALETLCYDSGANQVRGPRNHEKEYEQRLSCRWSD